MNVWTIDVDGTNLTQLSNGTSGWETEAVWSPDMTQICFDGLALMNSDGSGQTFISVGIQPSFRPDGNSLVYSVGGDIYQINTDGSGNVPLTSGADQDWHPDCSHDGTKIVFTSNRGGSDGIWTMDADGSNLVRIADSSTSGEPQWSPDDSRILFEGPNGYNIWVVNADGSGLSLIPTPTDLEMDASVINVHQEDDSYATLYFFGLIGFNGNLPGDVLSVTVTEPVTGGIHNLSWDSAENQFSTLVSGQPDRGVYTFTATTATGKLVTTDYQYVIHEIPTPTLVSPVDNATVAAKTPIFSWQAVELSNVPLYYCVEVFDTANNVLERSDCKTGTTGIALPEGALSPGDYRWRVVVADSNEGEPIQNAAFSDWLDFSIPGAKDPHFSLPAIHPNSWNGLSWTGGNAFACSVEVTDLDGVAVDGSSHTLTVTAPDEATFPDGTHVKTVGFDSPSGPTSGYYWLYVGGGTPDSGEYTFTVTDPDGNQATFVEQVDVNPLNGPDETSLTPSNRNEQITATFDNVRVNGQPYEDFNLANIDDLDPSMWKWPSGASIENNKLKLIAGNTVGRAHGGLTFADVEPITSVQAEIAVTGVSSAPSKGARIAGAFFNDGSNADFWVSLWNDGSSVSYTLSKQWINHQGNYQWEAVVRESLLAVSGVEPITVSVDWDEGSKTLTFTATNAAQTQSETKAYVHTGPVYPPIEEGAYTFTVSDKDGNSASITDDLVNNPIAATDNLSALVGPKDILVSWDSVPDALLYRINLYDATDERVERINVDAAGGPSFSIPRGLLKEGATYRYRIQACREWFSDITGNDTEGNMDNSSQAPSDLSLAPSFVLALDGDRDGLSDVLENQSGSCTLANDADSDEDGILDGNEDKNQNGTVDDGETDPCDADSDDDGLYDGTEIGLTEPQNASATDESAGFFVADEDSDTKTDPTNSNSDGDRLLDGEEDINLNGRVDAGESDPLNIDDPLKGGGKSLPFIPILLLDD